MGPTINIFLNRRHRSSTVGSRRRGWTSQFFQNIYFPRIYFLTVSLLTSLWAPISLNSKCQHASSGADNAWMDKSRSLDVRTQDDIILRPYIQTARLEFKKLSTSNRFPTERPRNLYFGSNMAVLGSGRGLNGRGAPIGSIWAEFQLKRSYGDPFRAQNNVFCETSFPGY